jgi:hypothetical protein
MQRYSSFCNCSAAAAAATAAGAAASSMLYSDLVGAGYAYIMTHPGIPCVFWDHYVTWGAELHNTIKTLAAVRRQQQQQRCAHATLDCLRTVSTACSKRGCHDQQKHHATLLPCKS